MTRRFVLFVGTLGLVATAVFADVAGPVRIPHFISATDDQPIPIGDRPNASAPAGHGDAMAKTSTTARPSSPTRIVSLAPSLTETLFAIGAGDRVVGVTRFCDRPIEAKARAKVGGYVDVQVERVLEERPDLVVAMPSMGQRAALKKIAEHGIPVAVFFADNIAELRASTLALGTLSGQDEASRAEVARLDETLLRMSKQVPGRGRRVLVLVGTAPYVAAGPGTFPDEVLRALGAERALPDDAPSWPQLSLETIIALAPSDIVVTEGATMARALRTTLATVGGTTRVLSAHETLLMRPGPSLPVDIEAIGTLFSTSHEDKRPQPTSTSTSTPAATRGPP